MLKYFEHRSREEYGAAAALHRIFSDFPGIELKERYKLPFYYGRSWICYLNPLKKGGFELAFTRGNELEDVGGLLSFRGRKQIAGVIFKKTSEIPEAEIRSLFTEAYTLDRAVPYTHPGKRGKKT